MLKVKTITIPGEKVNNGILIKKHKAFFLPSAGIILLIEFGY